MEISGVGYDFQFRVRREKRYFYLTEGEIYCILNFE